LVSLLIYDHLTVRITYLHVSYSIKSPTNHKQRLHTLKQHIIFRLVIQSMWVIAEIQVAAQNKECS